MPSLLLPRADRGLEAYSPRSDASRYPASAPPARSRIAFAAAHVVCDPLAEGGPERAALDWEATIAFRRHLGSLGLGVAEAMDTAQRGMGLDWTASRELIRRSAAAAEGPLVCGAQTDQLEPGAARSLDDVAAAYEEQCELIEAAGAGVVLMASRELCRLARGPEDYEEVYSRVLAGLRRPAILHWLGAVFDPQLAGYWGDADLDGATEVCLALIAANAPKIQGIKISLLDQRREVAMRRRLPEGVHLYTGDDFDYPTTIAGDGEHHSDALLGAFDMIAPAAAAALAALDGGDQAGFHRILERSLPLSRHVFEAPTWAYKTGVVLLAYLNGHQDHFRMVGGMEGARSLLHMSRLFVLADEADLLRDPELATERMRLVLALGGVA
jgi:hypothetical protein